MLSATIQDLLYEIPFLYCYFGRPTVAQGVNKSVELSLAIKSAY